MGDPKVAQQYRDDALTHIDLAIRITTEAKKRVEEKCDTIAAGVAAEAQRQLILAMHAAYRAALHSAEGS